MFFLLATLIALAAAACDTSLATTTCLGSTLQACDSAQKCACLQGSVATCVRVTAGCESDAAIVGLYQLQIATVQRCEQPAWTALPSSGGKCSASGDVYNKNRLQTCALRNGWPSAQTAAVCAACLDEFVVGIQQFNCFAENDGTPWTLVNLSYKCNATSLAARVQANPFSAAATTPTPTTTTTTTSAVGATTTTTTSTVLTTGTTADTTTGSTATTQSTSSTSTSTSTSTTTTGSSALTDNTSTSSAWTLTPSLFIFSFSLVLF